MVSNGFWMIVFAGIILGLFLLLVGAFALDYIDDEKKEEIFSSEQKQDSGQEKKDTLVITQIAFKK